MLVADTRVVAAYVAFPGAELRRRRQADLVALARECTDGDALRRRLESVRHVFAPVENDDWYLSKMAVDPARRGSGLGASAVAEYLREGQERGYTRFRLDVSAANAPAVALYRAHGFRVVSDASLPDGELRYLGLVRGS
jgi:ribosomal protein S18 acetylase RimI-like enzyme